MKRTTAQIQANADSVRLLIDGIDSQISVLDTQYQMEYKEIFGESNEAYDEMISSLKIAREHLNILWHMEIDALNPDND